MRQSAVNVQERWRLDDVVEESDGQGDESQRGGADGLRRSRLHEGLCVFEHPLLLLVKSLIVQLSTQQLPDCLVVIIQPLKLKQEKTLNESQKTSLEM